MSIEPAATQAASSTTVKPLETTSTATAPLQTSTQTPATAISAIPPPQTMDTTPAAATTAAAPVLKHEAAVETVHATEGVLGYKAPGLLK